MGHATRRPPRQRHCLFDQRFRAGVSPAETTIDEAEREMAASGLRPEGIQRIIGLMKLQYEFARTGRGGDEYAAARARVIARLGSAPSTFPGTPNDPYWQFIQRLFFYDPGPTLPQPQTPVLELFGELDDNILAEKNKNTWEAALKAGNNRDYSCESYPRRIVSSLKPRSGATRKWHRCNDSLQRTALPSKTGSRRGSRVSGRPDSSAE
jgi:hypothetical protein